MKVNTKSIGVIDIDEVDDGIETLSIKELLKYWNPFLAWFELKGVAIAQEEVLECLKKGEEELVFTEIFFSGEYVSDEIAAEARRNHIKKIAYFVKHGVNDAIDVEFLENDNIAVNDGNHRLCAKVIRGETEIESFLGGFIDFAYDNNLVIESVK
ncbi:hypothetical protein [Vibrio sp. D431a]|uniref:hypothetical protein n=1 Tax=Vibrio sp. D431a TaxID=2837388 RepID=UPI002556156A|nr:hypothetical protein [Vibrio sp. D431a]MDK9789883.1 hypothetical protein [Vibrio sp. D431a]